MTAITKERMERINYLKGFIQGATDTMENSFKVVEIMDHVEVYQKCNDAIQEASKELHELESG